MKTVVLVGIYYAHDAAGATTWSARCLGQSCDWESDVGMPYEEAIRQANAHGRKCKTPKTKNTGDTTAFGVVITER